MDLQKLKETMPFQWRTQSINDKGAQCVAYIDSRQAAERLDEVVGPANWQCDYKVINDNLYAGVGIWDDSIKQWVWKWDCGVESKQDAEKGAASDSFKRACVKWGIGRFLYDLDIQRVKTEKYSSGKLYPCDDDGNILWTGKDLTKFINNRQSNSVADTETSTKKESGISTRYAKPTTEPTYSGGTKAWSKAVVEKAGAVEKDGVKGSAALLKFVPAYNEAYGTKYKTVQDFDTDELLTRLIGFVEDSVPEKLKKDK